MTITTTPAETYAIRGGEFGRYRLRILSEALAATTGRRVERVGLAPDLVGIDDGCGGGDVTVMLAARAPRTGVGTERDPVTIDCARSEAAGPVESRVEDVGETAAMGERYDVVFVRFLLSQVAAEPDWVAALARLVAPGGGLVLEDVRISGALCSPASTAFDPSLEIY
jgi:2-polyprenyl-3-methyl-5-hydroxy-6-metoxy-1,4-benzoquinol methylase